LRSLANGRYVSAEFGYPSWTNGVLRARAASIGAWETFWCAAIGSTSFAIMAPSTASYVSTELGWPGSFNGTLRARAAMVGPWELYRFAAHDSCVSSPCYAIRGPNDRYVSAELGFTGPFQGLLRARATRVGPWEQFDVVDLSGPSVVSDRVTFTATPDLNGFYKSTTCSLVSDGEATPFSCDVSFSFGIDPFTGACGLSGGSLVSADGTTTFTGSCVSLSCDGFQLAGGGIEADAPENGKASPKYPATVDVAFTSLSGCFGEIAGTIVVSESFASP
jgi:hypothetical protein